MNINESALGRLRAGQGITQQALADKLDVTVTHLCRVERGRAKPSAVLAKRVARRLGVTHTRFWSLWNEVRRENLRAEMRN